MISVENSYIECFCRQCQGVCGNYGTGLCCVITYEMFSLQAKAQWVKCVTAALPHLALANIGQQMAAMGAASKSATSAAGGATGGGGGGRGKAAAKNTPGNALISLELKYTVQYVVYIVML
jgi:hypothetical protein